MKKVVLTLFLTGSLIALNSCEVLGEGIQSTNRSNTSNSQSGSLGESEVNRGLKEALRIGAEYATQNLNKTDGFFKNQAIKILLPKEAQVVESTLRSVGMGNLVDDVILKMNRAAENAAIKAKPIFISAITNMSIEDGMRILRGGQDAATQYLKRTTSGKLTKEFEPVIKSSLGQVGADRVWTTVFDNYNKIPTVRNKINPDLTGYVTEKALEGLFYTIAQEELKIRTDPAAQVTNTLKRVFGK